MKDNLLAANGVGSAPATQEIERKGCCATVRSAAEHGSIHGMNAGCLLVSVIILIPHELLTPVDKYILRCCYNDETNVGLLQSIFKLSVHLPVAAVSCVGGACVGLFCTPCCAAIAPPEGVTNCGIDVLDRMQGGNVICGDEIFDM